MIRRDRSIRSGYVAAALAALLAPGCASIIHGTRQDVSIASKPAGAAVSVDGAAQGKTPMVASLKRKQDHVIEITLDGYEPYRVTLTRKVSGWLFGNIIFGGIIGFIVDPINGAMYNLTPAQIDAGLKSGAITAPAVSLNAPDGKPGGDKIYIAVALRADPDWRRVATLERSGAH